MADDNSKVLINWAKAVITLLPLFGLIWGASTLYSQVQQNTNDIKTLKESQSIQLDRLTAQIADLALDIRELQTEIRLLRKEK